MYLLQDKRVDTTFFMVRSVNFENISNIGLCVRFHFYGLVVHDVLILLLGKTPWFY
jgi:hypothetical protein